MDTGIQDTAQRAIDSATSTLTDFGLVVAICVAVAVFLLVRRGRRVGD